jgi:protocatechuate 3,4-dioxygenase beta subunit
MKNIVVGLMTMMSLIVISLIYTTSTFAQSPNQTSTPLQQQQQNSLCKLTESDMLGPFYKEGAPFNQRLGEGVEGERLIITGRL